MPSYRAEAIVLRTHKLGEADRIITLLTRERGKIRAVAKGVRRTKVSLALVWNRLVALIYWYSKARASTSSRKLSR